MKLGEKIYNLRKKKGLSQVDLADMLGVSRQSVSNWETGSSNPEIGKLSPLAQALGVTVDFLLDETADFSEADSDEANDKFETFSNRPEEPFRSYEEAKAYPDWLDNLPAGLVGFIRRYGWFAGIYITLTGLGFSIFGLIGRALVSSFFSLSVSSFDGINEISRDGLIVTGDIPPEVLKEAGIGLASGPEKFMAIIPNAALIIGLILVVGGLLLAYLLKTWTKEK